MLLYDSPVSGNCYKVRLLFAHLGVAYERQTVDVVDRSGRAELLGDLNPAQRVPTLVLFGTLDRMIPPEMGRVYREKLGNGHFVLVYDAAHEIGADRPEAFTSLVSDFLDRHEQFVVSRTSGLVHP